MKDLRIPVILAEDIEDLSDSECGRLLKAMMQLHITGTAPTLSGNERSAWKRARKSIEKQAAISSIRSEVGKKGAEARWQNMANDGKRWQNMANDGKEKASPSSPPEPPVTTPVKEKKEPLSKERVKKKADSPFDDALSAFRDMRNRMRKPMTQLAVDLLVQKLEKLAPGDTDKQVAMLMQSIENGWSGVYELKQDRPVDRARRNNTLLNYKEQGRAYARVEDIKLDLSELDPDPPKKQDRGKKRIPFDNYKEEGVSHVNLDDIALTLEDEL